MNILETDIPGVRIIEPRKFGDHRGFFMESYSAPRLAEAGIDDHFVQDNHSLSAAAGTLRGLHCQTPPHAQAKLVRVTRGRVLDVAVDARRGSPTFGRHVAVELDPESARQLYVPVGFLHGFVTLEPDTEFLYKVSDCYAPECDTGVRFDDPDLGIDWGLNGREPVLSEKDSQLVSWADFDSPFTWEG
ncbi:dTDP-4-dehydrorhamnose 3,5-epimerase [Mucisphaera calidilacus]|uniref:dTDP-4-dehydrorhamnose 3,5-epimerase n=1 Tax=Mucisphaera calidilacus TaxID=2527982 RepID=A0A518BUP0_9BACT|nr:dTDP-4-dehydrorhamnose 3,5-epimerase [Mucisphaera calidilacus]